MDYDKQQSSKYLRYWIIGVIFLSILIILLQFIYNNIGGIEKSVLEDSADFLYFNSITPRPPTLYNFN